MPISNLHDLPLGAGYTDRWGRATVRLERKGADTILLTAHCDSLQMVIDELEVDRERLMAVNQDLNAKLKDEVSKTYDPTQPWRSSWIIVLFAVAAIIVCLFGKR